MRPEEIRAFGDLAADAGTGIADQARELHSAVAGRAFGALDAFGVFGLPVAPVRLAHDRIAHGSHGAARSLAAVSIRGSALIGAGVWRLRSGRAAVRPLAASSRGRIALGALGGVAGARLQERDSPLATGFALLVDDRWGRGERVAVFVHGLGETELAWRLRAPRVLAYGDRLATECALTPVYARYNSGLSIAENGAALAAALTELDRRWPAELRELTLVGHSMGGLVIRSACEQGRAARWSRRLRRTISLGSPHEGAPLARAAGAAERALSLLPETRPLAGPLRARSPGLRDLASGVHGPLHPGAEHYFVSASVSRDPGSVSARLLGDLLVLRRSAWAQAGRGQRLAVEESHYRHLAGTSHFDLLGSEAVSELLAGWIGRAPALAPASASAG